MTDEIRNIPALWSALGLWMSYAMYVSFMPKRLKNKKLVGVLTIAFLPLQILYMLLIVDLSGLLFNLGMVLNFVLTLIPFLLLVRASIYKKLYYCSRAFIIGSFVSSFGWQLYAIFLSLFSLKDKYYFEFPVLLLSYFMLFSSIYIIEKKHKEQIKEMNISVLSSVSTMAISYVSYVLSSLSYSSLDIPFGIQGYQGVFLFRTIIYLAGVMMLYANHLQLCEASVANEKAALSNMLTLQYKNYQMSQESIDLINQKYHDLKQQIVILRSEINKEQKTEFLDKLEYEIKMYEAQNKTGNQYLDTILTGKKIQCMKNNILLTCVADGKKLEFMDIMDLSAVFGNALDNAIEEVCKFSREEERLIHFSVSQEKGFVRVRIENKCNPELRIDNKIPHTSKADSKNHGYGLKSIKKIVEKYNGSMTIHAQDGWFEIRMLFPVNQ